MGTRLAAERRRLIRVADDHGRDGLCMWAFATDRAARAERNHEPLDRRSALTHMRAMLDELGISHRAWDGFGTEAPAQPARPSTSRRDTPRNVTRR